MYQLNDDIVYVRGAKKGAIYDFTSTDVYWINDEACELLDRFIAADGDISQFTTEEKAYISLLETKQLYREEYKLKAYTPNVERSQHLKMAWLEITQACNCRCLHCYQGDDHFQNVDVLELKDWKRVIDELYTLGVSRVVVIGGEPCMHKDICEILNGLYEREIETTLFTNATMIDACLMDLLIRCSDRISVKVSLYADNADDHDKITRRHGSFDELVRNVRTLTQNGATVDVAVVAMRENQDKLADIRQFIHSLGANYSKFDVIRNVFGGRQDQHTPTAQDIVDSCSFCEPHFKADRRRFDENFYENSCWFGKIAITETGDVLPCVFERGIIYGNVKKLAVKDILEAEELKRCWYMDFSCVESCKDCEFRYSCKDCRPLGISVRGDIHTKNPRCRYDPYTGQWR